MEGANFWLGVLVFGLIALILFVVAPAVQVGKLYQKAREMRVSLGVFFFEALSSVLFYWLLGFFVFSVFKALGYDVSTYVRAFFSPPSSEKTVVLPKKF